jgi:hypothetical protein
MLIYRLIAIDDVDRRRLFLPLTVCLHAFCDHATIVSCVAHVIGHVQFEFLLIE